MDRNPTPTEDTTMATQKFEVRVNGEPRMIFSGDFSQASSPVMANGESTPFQVADFSHRTGYPTAQRLNEWMRSNGGEAWSAEEEDDDDTDIRVGRLCGELDSNGIEECGLSADHAGPHKSPWGQF